MSRVRCGAEKGLRLCGFGGSGATFAGHAWLRIGAAARGISVGWSVGLPGCRRGDAGNHPWGSHAASMPRDAPRRQPGSPTDLQAGCVAHRAVDPTLQPVSRSCDLLPSPMLATLSAATVA